VSAATENIVYNVTRDTILILGHKIPISYEEVDQSSLRFYESNPRIYSIVRQNAQHPTQEEIERQLLAMEHVKQLIQDIKRNNGLLEPLIVRDETFEVLEGNSRLAAYRALALQDPLKWAKVRCVILPKDIDDRLVFALLAQLHVKGKKDWAPYEQAGFLYRRYNEQKVDLHTLAQESNLSLQRVRQLIDTYQFMLDSGEREIAHWSHYEEFLKSRTIAKARERFPTFQDRVIDLIQRDRTFKAVDVRDRLPKIVAGPLKNLKRFSEGKIGFNDAVESAVDAGADNNVVRKLNKFRQWLAEPNVMSAVKGSEGEELDRLSYELDKIRTRTIALETVVLKKRKMS
jgi:hypothetical protein